MSSQKTHGVGVEHHQVNDDARGTYYAELNATVPIGELIGAGHLKV
jgi:hypothetical protein